MCCIKRFSIVVLFFCVAVFLNVAYGRASESTFDDLYSSYVNYSRWEKDAAALAEDLSSKAANVSGYDLWKVMWNTDLTHEQRSADALKLISELFPGSDIKRWNEISGFWYPDVIPKSLAAIDAVYVAASELVQINSPGSIWLARNILNDLAESSRAKHYFMSTAPQEYKSIKDIFDSKGIRPAIGNWSEPDVKGELPLAVPVRGFKSMDSAIGYGYTFFGASGQIANLGRYAWDREKGRIYRVVDRDDDSILFHPFN